MEIQLENIGIIGKSSILLDGLTVITGKNESGKTTVGKVLYSLIDATSKLAEKAGKDREYYILSKMSELFNNSSLFRMFRLPSFNRRIRSSEDDDVSVTSVTNSLIEIVYQIYHNFGDPEESAHIFLDNLKSYRQFLNSGDWDKIASDSIVVYAAGASRHSTLRNSNPGIIPNSNIQAAVENIDKEITEIIGETEHMFSTLDQDPDLSHYAHEIINQTLTEEFSNQIHPISGGDGPSTICLREKNTLYFDLAVQKNQVSDTGSFDSPLRRVYFVDNPIVLDQGKLGTKLYKRKKREYESFINPNRITDHTRRLYDVLHDKRRPSVLEQTILNATTRPIMEKINSIIPGTFDFSEDEEYYVREDGAKLRLSNLAAGSKMFSIVKILLNRGLLDKHTLLILDEAEAHLHPQWQNQFAEVIVLLVKELGVKVLLTTHSSNFMLAIDAYMRKHGINELCNFYQTERMENGLVTHNCVNDNMEAIYQDFLEYMEEVKALRDRYDFGMDDYMDGDSEE